jgi:monoamine oxidase
MACSCIIVGGGLAGLAAAYKLTAERWNVTVLEAEHALGGRVKSHRFDEAEELVCELGAEWIGTDHRQVLKLCRELHLDKVNHQYSSSIWNGSVLIPAKADPFSKRANVGFKRFERWFNRTLKKDSAAMEALDRQNWWSVLKTYGFAENDLLVRDLMDSTDFGESIRLTSAYVAGFEYTQSNDTDEVDWKVAKGNSELVEALAKKIRRRHGRVHVNRHVQQVVQTPDGVVVHAFTRNRNGTTAHYTYEADFCICAIPAHAMNRIKWRPALPAAKATAASELQYSRIVKTAVLYASRFWRDTKKHGFSVFSTRVSDFTFHSTFRQPGPLGILCSYAIGDKADDLACEGDVNSVMRWITEDMVTVTRPKPEVIVAPIDVAMQRWQLQESVGGAYALYQPGQWFRVRPLLTQPHGRVHFAGEHLSEQWQGFMEGAVETGQAAAKTLLEGLRTSGDR